MMSLTCRFPGGNERFDDIRDASGRLTVSERIPGHDHRLMMLRILQEG